MDTPEKTAAKKERASSITIILDDLHAINWVLTFIYIHFLTRTVLFGTYLIFTSTRLRKEWISVWQYFLSFPFLLKVPKCEIFDRSDFHDFYTIRSLWEGDFGVKIKWFKKILRGSFGAAKFLTHMLSLILRRVFFEFGQNKFFFGKLLRPYVGVNSDFLKFSLF